MKWEKGMKMKGDLVQSCLSFYIFIHLVFYTLLDWNSSPFVVVSWIAHWQKQNVPNLSPLFLVESMKLSEPQQCLWMTHFWRWVDTAKWWCMLHHRGLGLFREMQESCGYFFQNGIRGTVGSLAKPCGSCNVLTSVLLLGWGKVLVVQNPLCFFFKVRTRISTIWKTLKGCMGPGVLTWWSRHFASLVVQRHYIGTCCTSTCYCFLNL